MPDFWIKVHLSEEQIDKKTGMVHCLHCPLRNTEDECLLQPDNEQFVTWEQQMEGCPFKKGYRSEGGFKGER